MEIPSSIPASPRPQLLRVPLLLVAVPLFLGIPAGRYLDLSTPAWALAAALFAAAALACYLRHHLAAPTALCLALTFFSLAAIHARLAFHFAPTDALVSYTASTPIPATVTGRVLSPPQTDGQPPQRRTRLLLEADSITTTSGPVRVSGVLRVGVRNGCEGPAPGDRVEVVGWLGRLRPPDNPGQYDWAANARLSGSLPAMDVHGSQGVRVLSSDSGLSRWLWRWRMAARGHLAVADPDTNRLLTALLIGDRHPALRQLNRAMMRAGTVHILSISGAHLAIFMGFVYLLCRSLAASPRRSAAFALTVLVLYMLLADPQPALLRSAVMAACLCIGTIAGRRGNPLNSLAAAAILLLAFDPMQLFDPGLQLSFAMVAGLILLSRPIRDALFARWRRRRGLVVFRGRSRLRRFWAFTAVDWFHNAVAMGLAATLAAMPLVAFHFGLFSPYAPILSLLLEPIVAAILIPSYLSLALAAFLPNVAAALTALAAAIAGWFVELCWRFDRLPGLCIYLRPVDFGWVVAWFLALALWAFRKRLHVRSAWVTCGVILVAIYGAYTQRPAPRPACLELDLLSVGPGQCALLRSAEGTAFLIDAGTGVRRDDGPDLFDAFCRSRRLPAPQAAFVSHPNFDHYSILASHCPPTLYLTDFFDDNSPPPAPAFLESLPARTQRLRLHAGQVVDLDSRTRVEVLWPLPANNPATGPASNPATNPTTRPAKKPADLTVNDTSLVLRVVSDGRSILFTGDLGEAGQSFLANHPGGLRSDVLVLPHHGHWCKTLPAFVAAVAPKVILISDGSDPHPSAPAASAFYSRLRTSFRTHATNRQGWLHLRLDKDLTLDTMRP